MGCSVTEGMLNQTVWVSRCLPFVSETGETEYDTPEEISAYIERVNIVRETAVGAIMETRHLLIVSEEIKKNFRLWLPGDDYEDRTLARMPFSVEIFIDPETNSTSHWEVIV